MLKLNKHYFIASLLVTTVLSSCVEDKGKVSDSDSVEEVTDQNGTNGSMVKYDGEIFSIPSPVQTAILIRKSNAKYNEDLLNSTDNIANYVTEVQKALNLGVYGADLAYLANFGNKQQSVTYFKEVEQLSTDLDVKGAIDNGIFSRFYENIDNRDSLYSINAEFYRAGDTYLKDSKRNQTASLIITGGWVEALSFAIDAASINPEVRKRIGEQGKALQSLVNLLSPYDDEKLVEVRNGLTDLLATYSELELVYNYAKPIHDVENKKTYINSSSNVVVSDDQLQAIREKLTAVRNSIIQ